MISLFTADQSTSVFKQLKRLCALGMASWHVSLTLQPFLLLRSSSSHWEAQPLPMPGQAGSSSPGAMCGPDTATDPSPYTLNAQHPPGLLISNQPFHPRSLLQTSTFLHSLCYSQGKAFSKQRMDYEKADSFQTKFNCSIRIRIFMSWYLYDRKK